MIRTILWRAAGSGILTGALLAFARISGETAPLLFTALNNQFFSWNMTKPMASLPVVIFNYALSAYDDLRAAGLGRRADHRRRGAGDHHHRPHPLPGAETLMNTARPRQPSTSPIARVDDGEGQARRRRNLDFFYGKTHALKGVSIPFAEKAVTALIGPSGCGKSTLLRALNRMYALYPGQRATGKIMLDGEDILRPGVNLVDAARPHRHGVPEADAVPDVDLRQRRLRRAPLREPLARPTWTTGSRTRCAARRCGTR